MYFYDKQNPEYTCRYALQLTDGSLWELAGAEEVSRWLAELAHILGCRPSCAKPTHEIRFHAIKDLSFSSQDTPLFLKPDANGWQTFTNGGILRIWRHQHQRETHVELHEDFLEHKEIRYINMWSVLRELHRHALSKGGTPVHAALAALDGNGILIAGTAGTGKSTCYSRLPNHWERLCDDQALILRMKNGGFRAHPLPTWSDHLWRESKQQWHMERSVPLKAAFFLEQASKDEVLPLEESSEILFKYLEAAKQVWQPAWSKVDGKEKRTQSAMLLDNVARIARNVPAYRLCATLHGEFWKGIQKAISG